MYTKHIKFKDLYQKNKEANVHFKLFERDVFKLLVELQHLMEWQENMKGPLRTLETAEVVEFYNDLESVLLSAYGVPSDDGLYFDRSDRYRFEDSVMFNAVMVDFVENPHKTQELIEGMLPKGMAEMVEKADASMVEMAKNATDDDLRAEIERLRQEVQASRPSAASETS